MNRNLFTIVVVGLTLFVGYTFYAGNRLPADVRTRIGNEQKMLESARKTVSADRDIVAKDAAAEPDLFHVRGFDQQWPGSFNEATVALGEADRYAAALRKLEQANRRSDRRQAEELLSLEQQRRESALNEANGMVREAQKRLDLKRNFAQNLKLADTQAHTLASTDYAWLTTKVEKAEKDWPSKKEDLAARLNLVLAPQQAAVKWGASMQALEAKPMGSLAATDYSAALDLEESVEHAPGPEQARELGALTGQLYTSWDNVLEDLDKDNGNYREHIKKISTVIPAPGVPGTTTSSQLWESVSPEQWRAVENDIGMAIVHKPVGKYDSEAEHTPEPAEFSYMASPAEGRNQYGYWENSGGGSFWHWLPEYLILRELLSNHHYQPIPSYEWGHYYDARRYGKTWYGTEGSSAPKYGSHGTFTAQRYGGSRYVQSGGYSASKYASGGGFGGSKYSSGGGTSTGSGPSSSGRSFGSRSSSSGHTFGGSSSGRSFGSRSSGRSFGGRRR